MPRFDPHQLRQQLVRLIAVAVPSLAAATLAVAALEEYVGVGNASIAYMVAVVATAFASGPVGAAVAAVASFLLYDFLFIEPRFTFTVNDPGEWLSVILLLFVGIVVGQLVALQRSRTAIAVAREREARALFQVSRALATRQSTKDVLPDIVEILRQETGMERVWMALGADDALERVVADSGQDERPSLPGVKHMLRRMPGEVPATWVRVHQAAGRRSSATPVEAYRVRIDAGAMHFGSIWGLRDRERGAPDRTETRLLAAAADQTGQALAHDRLEADAQAAEIARQSDALKSALLQSVSHDLRTPLATIRAAAGTLRPGLPMTDEDKRDSAEAIDREVEYLDRLVTNLLDLSRIEGGALRADKDVFEIEDLVGRTVDRLRSRLAEHPLTLELSAPPVTVDPVFLDEAVTNVIENAIKYTPPQTAIRIAAREMPGEPFVRLTVEDAGAGVPEPLLKNVFEKFYRVPGSGGGSRSGTGIGLAVVRGLVDAMGGQVAARRSELGGLAIDIDLPVARVVASAAAPAS